MTFEELGFRRKLYKDPDYFEFEKEIEDDAREKYLHTIMIDKVAKTVYCSDSTLGEGFSFSTDLTFDEVLAIAEFIKADDISFPIRPKIFAKG